MKTTLKYVLTLSMLMIATLSYAQYSSSYNDAIIKAQQELVELKSMDKHMMTKMEKKAWKRKKRALENFVNTELERERLAKLPNSPFYYGNPYAYGGTGFYGTYYNRYPVYRRPVVIVKQQSAPVVCTPTPRNASSNSNGYRRQAKR